VLDAGLQIGGAEWFSAQVIRYANPRLFEFVVLCYRSEPGGVSGYLDSLGVPIIAEVTEQKPLITFNAWLEEKVPVLLEECAPDFVFSSSQYLFAKLPSSISARHRIVVRISNYDSTVETTDFRKAARIICCSDEQYRTLQRRYPQQAVLIKTGVDVEQFCPLSPEQQAEMRRQLDLPTDRRIVLFCGRLGDPLKRTPLFQKVADLVLAQRPDITFVVAGYFERHRNEGEAEFQAFTESRGLVWRKSVKPWEMPGYFQAADALLSVSAKGEGLSNTVLQAMATATLPVVTPASGMSDLISDGNTGVLLQRDTAPAIAKKLLASLDLDASAASVIREATRRRAVEQFNLRDSVRDYERVFLAVYREAPAKVVVTDGVFGIGGAEWLVALLCLNCDRSKIGFSLLMHRPGSALTAWLGAQSITTLHPPGDVNYDKWKQAWTPQKLRALRPHVVMPCTSTSWDLSLGMHRLLGISQNASDSEVLKESHYAMVDYLICVSDDVRAVLDSRHRFKMTVLRNSIDARMFKRDEALRRQVRRRLRFADRHRVVLWCGRLSEHRKRIDVLCQVIEQCANQTDLRFLVVGYFKNASAQQARWEQFVAAHANVAWVTGLSHWETPPYFSAADFYLSTSGYTGADFEGLSLAAVQALAAGLPIVSTYSGGQQEVVTEGINGYLTPPGNAAALSGRLKKLAATPPVELKPMRAANVSKASAQFDIRAYARRYETICWSLKGTVDAALAYDPKADTELREFADAADLTPAQRHQASYFVNHLSPLLRKAGAAELPDRVADTGFAAFCEEFQTQTGRISRDNSFDELFLLWRLAEVAAAPILEIGMCLLETPAVLAGGGANPVLLCDFRHDSLLIELPELRAHDSRSEHPARGNSRWWRVCESVWRNIGLAGRIQRVTPEDLTPAVLPKLGLVVLHEGLSRAAISDGMRLAGATLVTEGALVLRGCGTRSGDPSEPGARPLGTPMCALLDYLQRQFTEWTRPCQVGSSVVLRRRQT
jgi:glycosyltransferase involved in cell wall biosynthesis